MLKVLANQPKNSTAKNMTNAKSDGDVYREHLRRLQNAKSKVDSNIYKHGKQSQQPVQIKRAALYAPERREAPNQPQAKPKEPKKTFFHYRQESCPTWLKSKRFLETSLAKFRKEAEECRAEQQQQRQQKRFNLKPIKRKPAIDNFLVEADRRMLSPLLWKAKKQEPSKKTQEDCPILADKNRVTLLQLNSETTFKGGAFFIPEHLLTKPVVSQQDSMLRRERQMVKVHQRPDTQRFKPTPNDIPQKTLDYYRQLMRNLNDKQLRTMLRPKIYLDLANFSLCNENMEALERVRLIGRLVFQLYTEACPAVVMEMVCACLQNSKESIDFNYIFEGIWLEAEFQLKHQNFLKNGSICIYDQNVLTHCGSAGVLSFPKRCLDDAPQTGKIDLIMSLERLVMPYGQRIAFGLLLEGHDKLCELQKITNKSCSSISVVECGVMEF